MKIHVQGVPIAACPKKKTVATQSGSTALPATSMHELQSVMAALSDVNLDSMLSHFCHESPYFLLLLKHFSTIQCCQIALRATNLLKLNIRQQQLTLWRNKFGCNNFSDWFLWSVQLVLFTNEAWFSLCREMNSQNNQYWSTENPRLIHKLPVPDKKLMFGAMSAHKIAGPIF